jgi:Fe-S cluster biosynthesis and repair protein YggX
MEYAEVSKEVWNELVDKVQNILEWEEMGNTFADWIHEQYVSINQKREEVTV